MNYADVSSAGLRYNLIVGVPCIGELDPIMTATLVVDLAGQHLECEVGILGASHYCMVRGPDNGALTEVFACREMQDDDRRIFCGPLGLGGKIGLVGREFCGLAYSFRAWTRTWSEETAQALMQLRNRVYTTGCRAVGLEFEFPSSEDNLLNPQRPVTLVSLFANPNEMLIATVHSYPNESLVVFTESRLGPQNSERTI